LLLQLERKAQGIRVQRQKYEVVKDLADKRAIIKRLRNRIEEIAREVELMGADNWISPVGQEEGETIFDVLQQQGLAGATPDQAVRDDMLKERKPVTQVEEEPTTKQRDDDTREELFASSTGTRRRGKGGQKPDADADADAQTTGYSGLQATERSLLDSSRTQEDITASLVDMAAQLKQQSRAMQFSLEQDKGILGRAIHGLDMNLSGMEAASKKMAFLKRMSEEEGWFGRMKLYAMIFGMWLAAFLLVFVCPKLRF